MKAHKQEAKEGMWLYRDTDFERIFTKGAYIPNGEQDLPDCTTEEKEQWEREHPQPEPEPQENK